MRTSTVIARMSDASSTPAQRTRAAALAQEKLSNPNVCALNKARLTDALAAFVVAIPLPPAPAPVVPAEQADDFDQAVKDLLKDVHRRAIEAADEKVARIAEREDEGFLLTKLSKRFFGGDVYKHLVEVEEDAILLDMLG